MKTIALAFSGGLDTSFAAVWLREELGASVVTVTADTGGLGDDEADLIRARALEVGSERHVHVDARPRVFDGFITYLIKGNCLRGGVYPMAVGAERVAQAETVVAAALDMSATGLCHGSTGAGNDGVRFDTAFRVLAPGLTIHAPIRSLGMSREDEAAYLTDRGIPVPNETKTYSLNEGLWGTTIGGGETHDAWADIPEAVYKLTKSGNDIEDETVTIAFERGVPISLNDNLMGGVELILELNRRAGRHGIGRGIHVGDTILGIKGRLAFEAPAAAVLITAHRELEKLILTEKQLSMKADLAQSWGNYLHEGLWFDPVMRDIEAFIDRNQRHVCGEVRLRLGRGRVEAVGVRSSYSLLGRGGATYGERSGGWTGDDAAAFARIYGMGAELAAIRSREGEA